MPLQAEPYLIGAEDDWYPYAALNDGKSRGMSVDIIQAAFAAVSADTKPVSYPYTRCMPMALRGKLVACFNTTPDARIAADYQIPATPLFSNDILLWARNADATPLEHLGQLSGKRVAVTAGYAYGSHFDNDQSFEWVKVRKELMGFLMLERRRADYFAAYRGTAAQLFFDHPELRNKFSEVAVIQRSLLFLSFSRQNPLAKQALADFEQGACGSSMRTAPTSRSCNSGSIFLHTEHSLATLQLAARRLAGRSF